MFQKQLKSEKNNFISCFIILSQIELYKVVLVRSEILLLPGMYVSGKTVLENVS